MPALRRCYSPSGPLGGHAALVREQVLRRTREELPHPIEADVEDVEEREGGLLVISARLWAETESQKAS